MKRYNPYLFEYIYRISWRQIHTIDSMVDQNSVNAQPRSERASTNKGSGIHKGIVETELKVTPLCTCCAPQVTNLLLIVYKWRALHVHIKCTFFKL